MLDSDGQCLVENFTVGRYGYGNVCFLGVTDVAGIDLDAVVFILRKQIEVYPEGTQKPPQGQELNKPAIVSILQYSFFTLLQSKKILLQNSEVFHWSNIFLYYININI